MVEVEVKLGIERAGEKVQASLTKGEDGQVEVFVPSVGTQRICRFKVNPKDLAQAVKEASR